jgi:hypothetical protein
MYLSVSQFKPPRFVTTYFFKIQLNGIWLGLQNGNLSYQILCGYTTYPKRMVLPSSS